MMELFIFRPIEFNQCSLLRITLYFIVTLFAPLILLAPITAAAESRWGADYFPNVTLTNQDGEQVRFFDDLIKDKIVAINFIYTSCPDSCPLETAQLVRVQDILGERVGKEIFLYSITVDPKVDTPQKLKEYRKKFGARWDFFTGNESEIIEIRKKLGLYIEEIQDGSNNHNLSLIIGNQKTGRWMKRSPFENAHVLADQLGSWLSGWKAPPIKDQDYANAPKLRNIDQGEQLFRTRCATCHSITGKEPEDALGPDLIGVAQRREINWLLNWLRAPDQMLADKDPIAMALYEQYDQLAMPNMRLKQREAMQLISYLDGQTKLVQSENLAAKNHHQGPLMALNGWIRFPQTTSQVHAGYVTLINVGKETKTLLSIESDFYQTVEIHEMTTKQGLKNMRRLESPILTEGGKLRLTPGGKHLMLMNPKEDIALGQEIKFELAFDDGERQQITMTVKALQ